MPRNNPNANPNPLICPIPGCNYPFASGRGNGLAQHVLSTERHPYFYAEGMTRAERKEYFRAEFPGMNWSDESYSERPPPPAVKPPPTRPSKLNPPPSPAPRRRGSHKPPPAPPPAPPPPKPASGARAISLQSGLTVDQFYDFYRWMIEEGAKRAKKR